MPPPATRAFHGEKAPEIIGRFKCGHTQKYTLSREFYAVQVVSP